MRNMKKLLSLVISSACLLTNATPKLSAAPTTNPRLNMSAVFAKGSFTYDWSDGAGGDLSYGANTMGVSEDGNYLYISCQNNSAQRGIAKLRIPALGGMATVVAPCQGPTFNDLLNILPSNDGGQLLIGGVLEQGGRMVVTGYASYDANNQARASHWGGTSLTSFSGPYLGTVATGMVKSHMAPIPAEWQSHLGGKALSSAGYTSIISRASYGASVSVFNPVDIGVITPIPMQMLLGCPNSVPACVTYGTPTSNDYNGSELSGGIFIAPGTRTLTQIEREASGPTCYGYTTRNPALHGTPYPDAINPSPEHVPWCYSLSDPMDQKGPKGYPYRLVAKNYDLNELLAVKQGTKQPWDIKQYETYDMPGSAPDEEVNSGAFNPVRGEYYLSRHVGGGVNTIYVYGGFPSASGPPPTLSPCDLNGDSSTSVIDVQLCSNQSIGSTGCTNGDIDRNGVCNVVDTQRVVNAALGGACVSP